MMKNYRWLIWVAIIVAWLFDFLFWGKQVGISLAIYLITLLVAGVLLARLEDVRLSWKTMFLLLPFAIMVTFTVIRREPMTVFLSTVGSLGLLGIAAVSFAGGRWWEYTFVNYAVQFFKLAVSAFSGAVQMGLKRRESVETDVEPGDESAPQKGWRSALPVVRGVLLATPVVLVLIALLSSADMIFASYVEDITQLFRLERLPEYLFRAFYITVFAYLLIGMYAHVLTKSDDETLVGKETKFNPKFLGFTESSIILGSVDLLFAVFVFIQFRYFFGGQTNIRLDGYTYAEYARRGFGELVAVAVISLVLFLGLSAITKRERPRQRSIFSGMGILLVLLVGVMLVSAFQRLDLYEQAYGFTRLRMYPRIFMIWLGVLLGALVLLELLQRQRRFALVFLAACLGFVLTLGAVNVDARITHHNVSRAVQGEELDYSYLLTLSNDAVPALWEEYNNPAVSEITQAELGGVLACQAAKADEDIRWQEFHVSDWRARQIFQRQASELSKYPVSEGENGLLQVKVNGENHQCYTWFID